MLRQLMLVSTSGNIILEETYRGKPRDFKNLKKTKIFFEETMLSWDSLQRGEEHVYVFSRFLYLILKICDDAVLVVSSHERETEGFLREIAEILTSAVSEACSGSINEDRIIYSLPEIRLMFGIIIDKKGYVDHVDPDRIKKILKLKNLK
ncbi:tset complex member tstd [Anaeramoeba flamelloides]|uniref:Tset complex member tstd n=1 Tax=Anaeramoeba flamelloides TaxID=1746091 RepID=A0ABQ8YV36_9EUKA|nr:tset complex member tstd [Anaeramoeba flamelloides]